MVCCPLTGSDGEGPSCYTEKTPTARKPHRCTECKDEIPAGAKYELISGIWDGRPERYKTCLLCVEIRNHFACGNGWLFGHLWSDLADNFFPDMKAGGPCMHGLSPEAKARLFERRTAWAERHKR